MLSPMAVTVLQILVGVIFVLLGIATANTPPSTKKEQWLCRVLFIFLGFLLLTLVWMQSKTGQQRAADTVEMVQTPGRNQTAIDQTELQQTFQRESGTIESNQLDLQQKYQGLLGELAANPSLDPNLRERLVVARAKMEKVEAQVLELKNWEANLRDGLKEARTVKQIQGEMDWSAAQSVKNKTLPFFDEAVKSLAAMSEKEAVLKGDRSILIYQGLPHDLSPEAKAGKRCSQNAAEIKFQTDAAWDFKIDFVEELMPEYEADMNITCKGGVLHFRSAGDSIETRVELVRGETFGHGPAPGNEAKTNMADALGKLLAAELDAVEAEK
jgi:hypothetical protein